MTGVAAKVVDGFESHGSSYATAIGEKRGARLWQGMRGCRVRPGLNRAVLMTAWPREAST